ncbi:high affinity immunoglobulin epsilon receptor subunit gamma isoform X2 [Micropterus dolomieu]|uniref:high affinity immunoglobulin epsilon receptor subunit gamma isoform X2 n=1 Tax=Micropterus dolomieu TaxID=147949 RepID=UPI001E8CC53C|nr:high affinity immunoglobulin epsilon receptor subunit gamma isoform X2 [Micropterus dolomieu]
MKIYSVIPNIVVQNLVCGTAKCAAGLAEPQICYVLDGILFLYGIILTALYCRIKIYNAKGAQAGKGKGKNVEEGIYTDLKPHAQDTYEAIGMKK